MTNCRFTRRRGPDQRIAQSRDAGGSLRRRRCLWPRAPFVRFDDETSSASKLPARQQAQPNRCIEKGVCRSRLDFQHDGEEVGPILPARWSCRRSATGILSASWLRLQRCIPRFRRRLPPPGEFRRRWSALAPGQHPADPPLTASCPRKKWMATAAFCPRVSPGGPSWGPPLPGPRPGGRRCRGIPRRAARPPDQICHRALADLRPLDALLALVEYGLETGDQAHGGIPPLCHGISGRRPV